VEIPVNQPVQYSSKQYTIPPYVLGLLLTESEVDKTTVLYSGKYLDILKSQMPNIEWEYNLIWSYSIPKDSQGNIISKEAFYGDILTDVENSIIPEIYLQGSIPQRWDILHGIMDVRGTVSNDNNVFCEIEQSMRESFQRLVNSLGLVVSIIEGVNKDVFYFKTNRKTIQKLFKTRQIEDRPYNSHIDTTKIAITLIEKEEEQREMVCFLVDNPDHLFLCNDFIVTHNTTSSRLFAKALNCKHLKENDICGECDTCKADLNNVPWYTEFDSSAMGNVDSIRELRDIFITTARGYNRVIVIDETHLLSKTAQSALLKVFEETPRGIYFILATTDPDKLLPTIRSRSLELIYTAKSSKEVKEDIDKHAKELGLSLSLTTRDVIATRSRGIMRNAHMLLDKVNLIGEEEFLKSDLPTTSLLNNFIVAILKTDRVSVLDTVSELSRIPVSYLKDDWQEYFLNLMRASIDPDLVQDDRIKKIASALGKQTVNIVKFCIQDWVIKSFQNSTQAQTAMLAIYQSLSKEQK
jgi:DNA polymerase III delta prime subunit